MTVMAEPEPQADVLNIPTEFQLLGRKFSPAKRMTVERDLYVMMLMRKANMAKLFERKGKEDTFELDELAEQVIVAAFESGKMFEMTAAVIDEVGVKWSQAGSLKLAQWLSELDEPEAKQTLQQYIAVVILGFFLSGPGFSKILSESLRLAASQAQGSDGSETSELQMRRNDNDASGELPVEPTITVNGESLSESSESSTPINTTESSSGP